MDGTLFCCQQNLLVEIAGGPIANTLGLGGQTAKQGNHGLLANQVILNHLSTGVGPLRLGGKTAQLSQGGKGASGDTAQTVEPLSNIVGMSLGGFIALLKKLMDREKFCPFYNKVVFLILYIQGLKTSVGQI